jgi:hypothetical protein
MKIRFYQAFDRKRDSEARSRSSAPDPRVTALLFVGLLAASFYGESLAWNDSRPEAREALKAARQYGTTTTPGEKTAAAQRELTKALAGC